MKATEVMEYFINIILSETEMKKQKEGTGTNIPIQKAVPYLELSSFLLSPSEQVLKKKKKKRIQRVSFSKLFTFSCMGSNLLFS